MSDRNSYLHKCLSNDSDAVKNGAGRNVILPPEKEPLWKLYLEKFKDPIIIVLLAVFFFSIVVAAYEVLFLGKGLSIFIEPSGVLTALLLATGVGFFFEIKAEQEFEVLNKVKDARPVKVFRKADDNGKPRMESVQKQDVVVGDIVKLEGGDEIPADGFVLNSTSFKVDESNFTGEPYVDKTAIKDEFDPDATYPSDFLLRGSIVLEGSAVYCVSAVGMDTEEAKGIVITREGSDEVTPLNRQLAQLGRWISVASFVIASLIVVGRMIFYVATGGFSEGFDIIGVAEFVLASIMIAVTLIVVAVPEGLPMSVTVSLALSMRKMLKENNLVRKLHACETMGAATVVCTDKTGTLTKNEMTVVETDFYGGDYELDLIMRGMAINSTAEVFHENGRIVAVGNPTESALLKWLGGCGIEYQKYRESALVVAQQPFSTETKYMCTTVENGAECMKFIKGAPEILLEMSDTIAGGMSREHVLETLAGLQARAMRTLGFAYQRIGGTDGEEIVFLGVVGIADPVRDDVKDAIAVCKDQAGVRVIIVTGDTPGTANEIGRQIGLLEPGEPAQNVTGVEFAQMSDEKAMRLVADKDFKILSRARPDDKSRLVRLLQANKEIVAVTGDGTNDAPALSKAHVGLSMGDGTARAKEASDITIIDNSFTSINKAIMWGRSLYLNIQRFILFQMTINLCACLIVLLGSFIGLDSPLTVTQMLWVNLIMDTFAAMALSSLPADKNVLNDKPRDWKSHIVNRQMLYRIVGVGMVFFVVLVAFWQLLWHQDVTEVHDLMNKDSLKLAITGVFDFSHSKAHLSGKELGIFFSIFVMLQFWNLFNARYYHTGRSLILDVVDYFRNRNSEKRTVSTSKGFWTIAVVILLGQIFIVTFAGPVFNVSGLSPADWGWILLLTSPVLVVADIIRTILLKI